MSVKSLDNLRNVIRHNLCNRCGACVGLSEGKLVFADRTGRYLPEIMDEPDEALADRLWEACPGGRFDFPAYRRRFYPETTPFHVYTGPYNSLSIGYATDASVRAAAASGGVLTAVLLWLLEKKMIEGAVVTGMSESEPWMPRSYIATTPEQIKSAAQSKYVITSVNELLPQMEQFQGRLAYVGVPGQVQAIRKLQAMNDPSVRRVRYILGPFFGETLHFSSIISFLRSYGVKDYRQITRLYFRYGEWPGRMRVELKDGRVIELKKFHANYLIPFHILKNSLLCTDQSNEFTDISGGDAWAPTYEERGKGFSLVVSRSETGLQILKDMQKEGTLNLTPLGLDEVITMHSHGYDMKKRGAFIRMTFRRLMGLPNPDYGYQLRGFPVSRYLLEMFMAPMFWVLGSRVARFLVERIPPRVIGGAFEWARTAWKKSTRGIKRRDLGSATKPKNSKLGWKAMVWAVLLSIPLSAVSLLNEEVYCFPWERPLLREFPRYSNGWGFPFPMYHGLGWTMRGDEIGGWDPLYVLGNLCFWTLVAMPIVLVAAFVIPRREKIKSSEEAARSNEENTRA